MPTFAACAAHHPTAATAELSRFPVLPEGMQRSQVESLLMEVASAIRLSGARLHALLVMIGYTRPQAWTDPEDEPVCYASQVELAANLGLTGRAVRAHERALSRDLGLIEKRTAANGSRSRSGGLGLVFSRLIALVPQLIALRDQRRVERSRVQSLVRQRSSHFRHLRDGLAERHPAHPDDPELGAIRDALLAWPASGSLRGMGLVALEAHVAEARALCGAFDALAEPSANTPSGMEMRAETSGRAEETFRSHLQETTEEILDFWSEEPMEHLPTIHHQADKQPAQPSGEPKREPKRADAFLAQLNPKRLYELAGEDMRLCLDMTGNPPERLVPLDFITAAINMLPILNISGNAWEVAAETMGDFRAALCVLITDANRTHPVTPIRSAGGHLRALTGLYRVGKLNLTGSLIGLAERRDAE